jgi:5-formyltetrahydrofolate cyclo-ligase
MILESYEKKRALRARMLALRDSKPILELDQLSYQIAARLQRLQSVTEARVISTYLEIGSEVRTMEIARWALRNGKTVIVPVIDRADKRLIFSELRAPDKELRPGTHGIPEPGAEFLRPMPLEDADVVLVPGVAWDQRGFRVGYGGGYYDRSINALRTHVIKIGLGYEFQLIPNVPRSYYDRCVDVVLTERRVINTGCR